MFRVLSVSRPERTEAPQEPRDLVIAVRVDAFHGHRRGERGVALSRGRGTAFESCGDRVERPSHEPRAGEMKDALANRSAAWLGSCTTFPSASAGTQDAVPTVSEEHETKTLVLVSDAFDVLEGPARDGLVNGLEASHHEVCPIVSAEIARHWRAVRRRETTDATR